MKILDPKGLRHLPKANLQVFLELIARGITTEEHTLVSKEYSNHVIELFEKEGCINDHGNEVLMERVEKCFENGTFDIEMLNQLLKLECLYTVKSKNYNFD